MECIYLFLLLRSVTTPPHSTLEMHILRLTLLFAIYHSLALSQWWVILVGRTVANHRHYRHYCSQVQFNCEKTPINQIFNNHAPCATCSERIARAVVFYMIGPWNTRSSTNLRTKVRWTHRRCWYFIFSARTRESNSAVLIKLVAQTKGAYKMRYANHTIFEALDYNPAHGEHEEWRCARRMLMLGGPAHMGVERFISECIIIRKVLAS